MSYMYNMYIHLHKKKRQGHLPVSRDVLSRTQVYRYPETSELNLSSTQQDQNMVLLGSYVLHDILRH